MDTNKYIAWCSSIIVILIGVTSILTQIKLNDLDTSSHVEEMYHKELVAVIDSIIDARGINNTTIDFDDMSISVDSLGRISY